MGILRSGKYDLHHPDPIAFWKYFALLQGGSNVISRHLFEDPVVWNATLHIKQPSLGIPKVL
jgi:hypothetical protein